MLRSLGRRGRRTPLANNGAFFFSWPSYYLFLPWATITVLIESPFASAATVRHAQSSSHFQAKQEQRDRGGSFPEKAWVPETRVCSTRDRHRPFGEIYYAESLDGMTKLGSVSKVDVTPREQDRFISNTFSSVTCTLGTSRSKIIKLKYQLESSKMFQRDIYSCEKIRK